METDFNALGSSTTSALSLKLLCNKIQRAVAATFDDQLYWVVAELSSCKLYEGKRMIFTDLVEKAPDGNTISAKIAASAFGREYQQVEKFEKATGKKLSSGLSVLLQVRVDYNPQYGLRLAIMAIDASYTLGQLAIARQKTLEYLLANFPHLIQQDAETAVITTQNQALDIPYVIQRIALVTSSNSEGYHDFTHTLLQNQFGFTFKIEVFNVTVQGDKAHIDIAKAIKKASDAGVYDAIVLIRGGGAQTDFLPFDQLALAQSIIEATTPVFTGIGHHRDISLADTLAYTSLKTPTKVAEGLIAHNANFEASLLAFSSQINKNATSAISVADTALNALSANITGITQQRLANSAQQAKNTFKLVTEAANRCVNTQDRQLQATWLYLSDTSNSYLSQTKEKLNLTARLFGILQPNSIMGMGYASVTTANGKPIDAKHVPKAGAEIAVKGLGYHFKAKVLADKAVQQLALFGIGLIFTAPDLMILPAFLG